MFRHSADGEREAARQNFRVHTTPGFLTTRQRRFAWLGFGLAALNAPVSALLVADASWLFSMCVALLVATVILADDAARRRVSDHSGGAEK